MYLFSNTDDAENTDQHGFFVLNRNHSDVMLVARNSIGKMIMIMIIDTKDIELILPELFCFIRENPSHLCHPCSPKGYG